MASVSFVHDCGQDVSIDALMGGERWLVKKKKKNPEGAGTCISVDGN